MTPEQRERRRERNRVSERRRRADPEYRARQRLQQQQRMANPEYRARQNALRRRHRAEDPERARVKERLREQRRWVANITPEQLERRRERKRVSERRRVANMTTERLARKRERDRERMRASNMSPGQLAGKRERTLLRRYRITAEQRDALAIAQGCACACCGDVARLVVDHDHTTGKLRALLCNSCNLAIGLLKDDPERAIAAAEYLAKHQRPILALVA